MSKMIKGQFDVETGNETIGERASKLHNMILTGQAVSILALTKIAEESLYTEFGYTSFKEYAEEMLPFDYGNAKRYIFVGRKFNSISNLYHNSFGAKGTPVSLLGINQDEVFSENEVLESITKMGISKAYDLARLDDETFNSIVSKESKVKEILALNRDEVRVMVKALLDKELPENIIAEKNTKAYASLAELQLMAILTQVQKLRKMVSLSESRIRVKVLDFIDETKTELESEIKMIGGK